MGIEPTLSAWEAEVLPLNYTRPLVGLYPASLPSHRVFLTACPAIPGWALAVVTARPLNYTRPLVGLYPASLPSHRVQIYSLLSRVVHGPSIASVMPGS